MRSILVITYNNNSWFWIENQYILQGAGKQYFILEKSRAPFTLGSVYASLVQCLILHNAYINKY